MQDLCGFPGICFTAVQCRTACGGFSLIRFFFSPVRWGTRTYSHQIRTYLNLSFRKKWMFRHTPERLPAKKKKQTEFHRLLCCTRYIHQRTVSILSVLSTQIYSEFFLCPLPSLGRTAAISLFWFPRPACFLLREAFFSSRGSLRHIPAPVQ